jgi:rhomboid family GlyGly-CTERM serine protease
MGGASLFLCAPALLIALLPQSFAAALQYDRTRILSGELHRLLTCHWTHWSGEHFAWDAITFLALGIACERRSRARFPAVVGLCAFAVPLGLLLVLPNLHVYRGLSGIDTALFGFLAVGVLRDSIRRGSRAGAAVAGLFIVAFAIKTCVEFFSGVTVFVDARLADFAPVPLAHLLGFAAGAGVALAPSRPRALPGAMRQPSFLSELLFPEE